MKKSLIALAVSAAVIAPSFAAADVTVGGDARVRYNQKTMKDDVENDIDASGNSRIRITVDAKSDDGMYMKSRFSTADGTMGGSRDIKTDYGFIGIPLGPVTIEGGRVQDNWGNRLLSWDEDYDQTAAIFKAGEVDVSIWRATNIEGGSYDKELGQDANDDSDLQVCF